MKRALAWMILAGWLISLAPSWAYRDLETGTFITRDPAGFVDGPNLYSYVVDNPWTKFDPQGLFGEDVSAYQIESINMGYQQGGNAGAAQANTQFHSEQTEAGKMAAGAMAGTAAAIPISMVAPTFATATAIGRFGVSIASGTVGGYVANGTTNALNGQPFNQNGGIAAATGAALGVLAQGASEVGSSFSFSMAPMSTKETADASEQAVTLTAEQAKNVARFERKLPGDPEPTVLRSLPNDGVVAQAKVPGQVPGSSATHEKQIDASGKTTQFTKTTVNPAGEVIHVKDKITGTQLP